MHETKRNFENITDIYGSYGALKFNLLWVSFIPVLRLQKAQHNLKIDLNPVKCCDVYWCTVKRT